ncbi:MAG: hypothetical protein PUF12_12725 [Thermoflexaceae bacterium]|nr:hypothetical protein [Thermoflexaceae bacterium]
MSNQMDLKQEIKAEKGKFKKLSFGEKITYIKDYYWMHILAVIIIAITIFAIYQTYKSQNYNTVLYTVLVNNDKSMWDEDTDSYESVLSKSFEQYLGVDGDKDRVIIDNNYVLDYDRDSEMSVYSAESLVAMIYASHLDLLIGNELSLDYFCEDEDTFFYNLDEIFDEEFLQKYEDKIIYYTYTNGTTVPIAFDITDCKLSREAELTVNPVLISIFSNTERLDTAVEYIKFILEGK